MKFSPASLAALCLVAVVFVGQAEASAEATITPVIEAYEKAFEENRLDDVVALYDDDAVIVEKGSKATHGRDKIKAYLEAFSKMDFKEWKVTNKHFDGGDDVILYSGTVDTSYDGKPTKSNFVQIFRKTGDKWKMLFEQFSV